jgi:hypothetical protein
VSVLNRALPLEPQFDTRCVDYTSAAVRVDARCVNYTSAAVRVDTRCVNCASATVRVDTRCVNCASATVRVVLLLDYNFLKIIITTAGDVIER